MTIMYRQIERKVMIKWPKIMRYKIRTKFLMMSLNKISVVFCYYKIIEKHETHILNKYLSFRLKWGPWKKATATNQASLCAAIVEIQSFLFMPSLAKLIPKTGSGSSGGSSSVGNLSFHDSLAYPTKHKLSWPENKFK